MQDACGTTHRFVLSDNPFHQNTVTVTKMVYSSCCKFSVIALSWPFGSITSQDNTKPGSQLPDGPWATLIIPRHSYRATYVVGVHLAVDPSEGLGLQFGAQLLSPIFLLHRDPRALLWIPETTRPSRRSTSSFLPQESPCGSDKRVRTSMLGSLSGLIGVRRSWQSSPSCELKNTKRTPYLLLHRSHRRQTRVIWRYVWMAWEGPYNLSMQSTQSLLPKAMVSSLRGCRSKNPGSPDPTGGRGFPPLTLLPQLAYHIVRDDATQRLREALDQGTKPHHPYAYARRSNGHLNRRVAPYHGGNKAGWYRGRGARSFYSYELAGPAPRRLGGLFSRRHRVYQKLFAVFKPSRSPDFKLSKLDTAWNSF
ncbi:hypothetical protein BDN72DRAFT_854853 [Pluteus cervinus]|uniref:Uncharacterized protein n=1 Tax=Pluteus cervinus TaxID=181527 RepID=A0ACD3B694_9AGAR|nr:hypothetical protein BDN72DRAFT_854853 [Pluteus cervinus]